MFIYMQRSTWYVQFKDLISDWQRGIWPVTWEIGFCQIKITITFHFRLFSGKTNEKSFRNMKKHHFWGKIEFSSKLCSYEFFLIMTNYQCIKFSKKNTLMSRFQASLVSDGHMDGQAQIYRTLDPVFYFCKIWFSILKEWRNCFSAADLTPTSTTNLIDTARLRSNFKTAYCILFFPFSCPTNFSSNLLFNSFNVY